MREGSAFQARRGQKDAQVGKATPALREGPAILAPKATEGQRVLLYASRRRVMQQTTPIWVIEAHIPSAPLQGHLGGMHR